MKIDANKMSPMMKQFFEAKKICPEALLLFRMGDFYEMFFDDAKIAAKLLGLALTSRERGPDGTPMAGFPHHQLDQYIAKIIAVGYRAAVCDQMEDPKTLKSGQIVKRAVTRIVTAGTVTEETLLDPKESNYLAAVCFAQTAVVLNSFAGIAWVELSTGAFFATCVPADLVSEHIARIAPSELIISDNAPETNYQLSVNNYQLTKRPDWTFNLRTAYEALLKQFQTATLEGFGFTDSPKDQLAVRAAGAVLDYLNETQRQTSVQIDSIQAFHTNTQLEIDEASRRSLEITRTIRGGRRDGSLLGVLDKCMTPMGSRYLGECVAGPLLDIDVINDRLDAVEELYNNDAVRNAVAEQLRKIYDLQRIMTRVLQGRGSPRDLSMIARTLRTLPFFHDRLSDVQSIRLKQILNNIDPCGDLTELLDRALIDDIPLNIKEGGFIRSGFSTELDELRLLQKGGKDWIANYQAKEIQRSGIPSLKVGFTSVFGYYIEITNVHNEKVPENYVRKQTLKNAERYITPELKEYEEKVLSAAERAVEREMQIFADLQKQTCERRTAMQNTAKALAALDVIAALASLAREMGYIRPVLVRESVLNITDGRHPVLDALEPAGTFVPNDTIMNIEGVNTESGEHSPAGKAGLIQLITGPNMSGKSTFIRQTALLCIMAQTGSFIPARSATVGICDRIFARVGASDEISRGQSTFMVEMTETARILHQATPQSLVILDEIGRGTSTYDGMSLAWAITEYLHERISCRTLFATHYHELTGLADTLDNVSNLNVAVREQAGDVTFLHKIVPGAADKSYGIHVAKLAGVPKEVVNRAADILAEMESGKWKIEDNTKNNVNSQQYGLQTKPVSTFKTSGGIQFSLFGEENHPVLDELRELDIDELKPVEALQLLAKWKRNM
ncbi:DNA mismatch repair protein MutS [Planctomycetales bacterium]|nr:DNA mismatch repair protein MutS [Planctomycetales bacterium]